VVQDLARSFDYFWNGEWSYPVTGLVDDDAAVAQVESLQQVVDRQLAESPYPYPVDDDIANLADSLQELLADMTWAKAWVVADDPAAIGDTSPGIIAQSSLRRFERLQRELLIESAYFVPTDSGVTTLSNLVDRGVRVRVLTNSLASNDVVAAHAGYEKTRKDLLEAGIELYELRSDSGDLQQEWPVVGGESKAALHTKSLEFDGEAIFVGSFNLDPRSASINTEIGIYVESAELAAELKSFLDQGVDPENAYRVVLDSEGQLEWIAANNGTEIHFDKEPKTGWWQRFVADFIKLLPVESQL
jgi:putative cardiolipin synthase